MTDKQLHALVARATKGDKEALSALCEYKAKDILYICIKLTGKYEDGQDAAQEVLLYMHTSIGHLRKPERFGIWLNRVISGTCIRTLRRSWRHAGREDLREFEEEAMEQKLEFLPEEWAENREMRALVLEALDELPTKQRHVLMLYYYEDLPVRDIAAVLNTTPGTVSVALNRARAGLKKRIQGKTGATVGGQLHSVALPVLTAVLRHDAASLLTEQGAKRMALAAAAAAAGGAVAATGGTVAASFSFAFLVPFLPVAALATAGLILAGPSSSRPPSLSDDAVVPQQQAVYSHYETESGRGEDVFPIDEPDGSSTSYIYNNSSSTVHSGVGPGSSQGHSSGETGSGTSEGDGATAQLRLEGRVTLADAGGAPLSAAGVDLSGVVITALRGGEVVATAQADAAGSYTLYLPTADAYTLRAEAAATLPLESVTAVWQPGESAPQLRLRDTQAPVCALEFYSADGAVQGGVNPHTARLYTSDATPVTTRWQVHKEGQAQPVASGSGAVAQLGALAPGVYTISYTATDLAGNTSTLERVCIIR